MANKQLTPEELVVTVYKSAVLKHELVGDDASHTHGQITATDVAIETGIEDADEQVAEEFENVEDVSAKTTEDYAEAATPPKSSETTQQSVDNDEPKPVASGKPAQKPATAAPPKKPEDVPQSSAVAQTNNTPPGFKKKLPPKYR
jgi:hypothetical protein